MILDDNDAREKQSGSQALHRKNPGKRAMDKGLWQLNCGIAFMLASSAANGYNMSLINGLLSLPECKPICNLNTASLSRAALGLTFRAGNLFSFQEHGWRR